MATLYEIDQAILECIDVETGEIVDPEKLDALQLERESKLEGIALWIKNLNADAEAYKAEKDVFAEREKAAKNKVESLKRYLSNALNGQKMQTNRVAISFRKSETVEIEDEEEFVYWAASTGNDDMLSYKTPTPNKTAIKAGIQVNAAKLVDKNNIQIK